jgi:uncharacterized protein YyaL (SSP411 family)
LASALTLGACHRAHVAPSSSAPPETAGTQRSTDEIRRDGNHLVGQRSIYLLQHSKNPVDWYPWGAEALDRAKREDKPIFLSIGYSSCHWCHVMEAEVFEKDDVAEVLNLHFISIKVDREERPDLDEAYMRALVSMTGGGGWPMSLFLTPSLRPFFGGTYLPYGRFLAAAGKASGDFASARNDVERRADQVATDVARGVTAPPPVSTSPIAASDVRAVAESALTHVDAEWGGFRGNMKFPTPVRWAFLLHAARKWGEPSLVDAVRTTLDAMAVGGIRDPIGGGFHRYSTDARWETPHFEKMLYDNAQLATLYVEAGLALHEPRYVAVATDTLDFMLREMQDDDGGFYASIDADSGGREGAYYVFTRDELLKLAGPDDGAMLARLLGITGKGAFDGGAAAPNRRASFADVAAPAGRTPNEVVAKWATWRPQILAMRSRRARPRVDTKIVTAWNGLAITALARAFEATGDARYRDAALRAADWMWRVHRPSPTGLVRDSNGGHPEAAGVLEDYAFFAQGLIALFDATGRADLLDHAMTLVAEADARFGGAPRGGWYDAEAGATPFPRDVIMDDSVEPSGSAVVLWDRIELGSLTAQAVFTRTVDASLGARANELRENGMESAGWLDAALLRIGPSYDVVVAGDDAAAVERLERVARALGAPWIVSAHVGASRPDAAFERLVGASQGKTSGGAAAKAYVCVEGACKAPTSDPATVRALLLGGWAF